MPNKPDEPFIIHGIAYDPQRAHEYYLRTRELKGRKGGVVPTALERVKSHPSPKGQQPRAIKPKGKNLQEEAHLRQVALNKRLDHLRDILRKLVAQSKKRSGADTPSKSSTAKKSSSSSQKAKSDTKPLTAKQKNDAAARAHKSYEKNKDKAPSKDQAIEDKIANVREQIAKIRKQLEAAATKARSQSTAHVENGPQGR